MDQTGEFKGGGEGGDKVFLSVRFAGNVSFWSNDSFTGKANQVPHPIFKVEAAEIQKLDDVQARELVARLCRAELSKSGLSEAGVTWGGDQRAKDGGVDVRVEASGSIVAGYLPNINTAYQVKAEKFLPAKIAPEMAPAGKLRPAIEELAARRGAYVIASSRDSLSDSALKARKEAMKQCLSGTKLEGSVALDFFDSRKLADWTEQYPSVVTWIKTELGQQLTGWQSYGAWAYREDDPNSEYIVDDKVKVFVPNKDIESDITEAINALRGDLSHPRASIRLVGLSGVGKTRLVQALFDKRLQTSLPALSADNVIYTDLSDNPDPQPIAMLEALQDSNSDAVLIVDNCGAELHKRLSELVARMSSKLKLVTVEYDIRDDLPENTTFYRLEGSSDSVIKELLSRKFRHLSQSDVDRVTAFSDGNARVAFALASASEKRDELASLADEELFRRLFHQKHEENDELLRCAEVASLVYSFDGEDASANSELGVLASLAEVSVLTFNRNIAELMRRGLVQSRGKWRAVLPHAISNRLAARALTNLPQQVLIQTLIIDAPPRIQVSFSRRLGYLHNSDDARSLVTSLVSSGGRFSDLVKLGDNDRRIFQNIAPVEPALVLKAIDSSIKRSGISSEDRYLRSELARLVHQLAYDEELFDDATVLLVALAATEPDEGRDHSALEVLTALFHCRYSGTHAAPQKRFAWISVLFDNADQKKREIGWKLLNAGLQTEAAGSLLDIEFGSRRRDYGWWPRTQKEVEDWFAPYIELATNLACGEGDDAKKARSLLGSALRGLFTRARMTDAIENAALKISQTDDWPEGWNGVKDTLRWDKDSLPTEIVTRLEALEKQLAPNDLRGEIRGRILSRGLSADDFGDEDDEPSNSYERSQRQARQLGEKAAKQPDVILSLMPELLSGEASQKALQLGQGLGASFLNPIEFLDAAREFVARSTAKEISLIPLRGFLSGWQEVDPAAVAAFLDRAVEDPIWGPWFPELQASVAMDVDGHRRIMSSLSVKLAPVWQYGYLSWGRTTDPLDVEQISEIANALSQKEGGVKVAVDLLGMVVHTAKERGDDEQQSLRAEIGKFLSTVDWNEIDINNSMAEHHAEGLLKFFLSRSTDLKLISEVLEHLLDWERTEGRSYAFRRGRLLKPFFKFQTRMALDAIYQPDDDGRYRTARLLVANRDNDRGERPMSAAPTDELLSWCEASPPDRYPFVAQTCLLYKKKSEAEQKESEGETLSEIAQQVFKRAPDKGRVLSIYLERLKPMSWSGSRAAILRARLKIISELDTQDDDELAAHIERERKRFNEIILEMEVGEQREEQSRNASFE